MADLFVYENGSNTLAFLLFSAVIGIIAACVFMLYQIKVPGRLVRALSERKAYGEDTAVSAASLGYHNEWLLRFLLSQNGALSKYVAVTGAKKDKSGKDILHTAGLYLREETKDRAELRYRKKNATVGALIAAIVLFSALAVALHFVIPELITMLENFIDMVKPK